MTELYAHQKLVLDQLHTGSILYGGVGSGKSLTSLAYFDLKASEEKLYIITTARKRDTKEWENECAIYGISMNNVTIDSWNNLHKYISCSGFYIFDEQRVVGSGAWVKSFLKITKKNNWILLTATPGDSWLDYIPVFIANGFYRNRTEFLTRHAVYSRYSKYPKIDRFIDISLLEKYRRSITIKMEYESSNRRCIVDQIVPYNKQLYLRIFKDRWNPYTDAPIKHCGEYCYVLRKAINNDIRRVQTVMSLLNRHQKLIVFYNFDYELELLRTIPCEIAEWNGHQHNPIPLSSSWIYLVQYTAGAEGWNCIETNAMVFFSLNYSYKIMTQAAGRIDRINSPFNDLYYYRLYSESSIDRSILRALSNKKTFNELLFDKESASREEHVVI